MGKKLKSEKGSVTIEASICLTIFVFFIMSFLSFGQIFSVQNKIDHAVNETAKNASVDSFWRKKFNGTQLQQNLQDIQALIKNFDSNYSTSTKYTTYSQLNDEDKLTDEIESQFVYFLSGGDKNADLDKLMKKNNISSLEFKDVSLDDGVLSISLEYTVKPQFAFLDREVKMQKCVKMKLCDKG